MQALKSGLASSGIAPLPCRRTRHVTRAGGEEIYIGFPKGDYDRTPGRKGRVIKDDPKKYPGREDLGPLKSVVGGWAGGEAGLWELREQYQAEQAKKSGSQSTYLAPSSPLRPPAKNKWGAKTTTKPGKDAIYVGFAKDELELKKAGVPGRVIYDEAYRYPGREDIGPFKSVVGGFAGGEAALKDFAETGELKLRKPGEPIPRRQFSPLTVAFLVFFVVAGGSALLSTVLPLAEDPAAVADAAASVSEVAKVLYGALLLGGGVAVLAALRTAVEAVQQQIAEKSEDLQKTAITIVYFALVAAAAYAILEAP